MWSISLLLKHSMTTKVNNSLDIFSYSQPQQWAQACCCCCCCLWCCCCLNYFLLHPLHQPHSSNSISQINSTQKSNTLSLSASSNFQACCCYGHTPISDVTAATVPITADGKTPAVVSLIGARNAAWCKFSSKLKTGSGTTGSNNLTALAWAFTAAHQRSRTTEGWRFASVKVSYLHAWPEAVCSAVFHWLQLS